jgi:putative ABC transport system ATP-binding protein
MLTQVDYMDAEALEADRMIDRKPSLRGENLTRTYGSGANYTEALRDVSIELYEGQLALLMGPNGSGKSTLLAVLSGLLTPDHGRVTALGQDLYAMSEQKREEFRLRHCGFIFQGYNLFPALTARQQLELVLRWGEEVPAAKARKAADEMLKMLHLEQKGHLRPMQLSGGEKQRVAIGRALIKEPIFFFADEPTAALEWKYVHEVIDLLRSKAHSGATVLVVAHDPRLEEYADRLLELEDGQLVKDEFVNRPLRRVAE